MPQSSCPHCGAEHEDALLVGGLCPSCVAQSVKSGLLDLLSDAPAEKEAVALNIEGYEVHELIGGGGMGEVYRATNIATQATLAIKVVAGRLTRDPEVTARFENEVSALSQLDHPNVVRVIDQGPGIDERIAGEIFRPFVSTKAMGTGLGLTIAKKIIEQHNGSVELARGPGGGTTARIELPMAPPEVD